MLPGRCCTGSALRASARPGAGRSLQREPVRNGAAAILPRAGRRGQAPLRPLTSTCPSACFSSVAGNRRKACWAATHGGAGHRCPPGRRSTPAAWSLKKPAVHHRLANTQKTCVDRRAELDEGPQRCCLPTARCQLQRIHICIWGLPARRRTQFQQRPVISEMPWRGMQTRAPCPAWGSPCPGHVLE